MALTNNFIQKWIKKVPNMEQEVINNKSQLEDIKYFATPQMYGAVGDGVTDDTKAFNDMLSDIKINCFIIPKGKYLIKNELIINRSNIELIGENGGLKYAEPLILCENCDGINIKGNVRFITIGGFELRGTSKTKGSGIKFTNATSITKVDLSNLHINKFKYNVTNCRDNDMIISPVILWNCQFKNLHFYSGEAFESEYGFFISNETASGDNFGICFENIFLGTCKNVIKQTKADHKRCNFAIGSLTTINFNSSFMDFENCNFECDEKSTQDYIMKMGNMSYTFNNCQFILDGSPNTEFFRLESSLANLKFKNCYAYIKSTNEGKFWNSIGTGVTNNGVIKFEGYNTPILCPSFSGSIYKGTVVNNFGLAIPCKYDTNTSTKLMDYVPYISQDKKQIEYFDGANIKDIYGNLGTSRGSFPIKIGNGCNVDSGEVNVTGNRITITHNTLNKGIVFVENCKEVSGNLLMITEIDNSPTNSTYKIKKWDISNKTWVDNDLTFTLKWVKLSF